MISVILAILKIIGIVLLCLLGLLLLIILAVLLVPIRYQAAGSAAEKEIHARAGISWLLHLIQVKLELVNQKGWYYRETLRNPDPEDGDALRIRRK